MTSGWDAWGQDDDWERWTARPPRVEREPRERVERPSRERARTLAVVTSVGVLLWCAGLLAIVERAGAWGVPLGGVAPSNIDGASPDQMDHVRAAWGMLQLTTLPVMVVLSATAAWSARRRRMRWSPAVALVLSGVGVLVGLGLVLQGIQTWALSR
ncbi:hypothetical protein [Curtobacterium sp. CFBP9011]|uniref:hypothetical protein n=1 Tax=Curtobacterium sp. CFBP9011 TaxID=3096530 RepID=UPI002A6AB33D|nr:hypothetical protein [Curtobacterium sp. CFBP9011]MDY1005230.1 hypothetical protein [Curtobacterium sp. CFBP9011]